MTLLGNLSESEDPNFLFVCDFDFAPISDLLEPGNATVVEQLTSYLDSLLGKVQGTVEPTTDSSAQPCYALPHCLPCYCQPSPAQPCYDQQPHYIVKPSPYVQPSRFDVPVEQLAILPPMQPFGWGQGLLAGAIPPPPVLCNNPPAADHATPQLLAGAQPHQIHAVKMVYNCTCTHSDDAQLPPFSMVMLDTHLSAFSAEPPAVSLAPAFSDQLSTFSQLQPAAGSQLQPAASSQPQPAISSQPPTASQQQPAVRSQPQPAVRSQLQPAASSQPQPAIRSQLQPAVRSQQQPAANSRPQPAVRSQPQPAVRSQLQPLSSSLSLPPKAAVFALQPALRTSQRSAVSALPPPP